MAGRPSPPEGATEATFTAGTAPGTGSYLATITASVGPVGLRPLLVRA